MSGVSLILGYPAVTYVTRAERFSVLHVSKTCLMASILVVSGRGSRVNWMDRLVR